MLGLDSVQSLGKGVHGVVCVHVRYVNLTWRVQVYNPMVFI